MVIYVSGEDITQEDVYDFLDTELEQLNADTEAFVTDGLEHEDSYTTAYDAMLIARVRALEGVSDGAAGLECRPETPAHETRGATQSGDPAVPPPSSVLAKAYKQALKHTERGEMDLAIAASALTYLRGLAKQGLLMREGGPSSFILGYVWVAPGLLGSAGTTAPKKSGPT
ncbi:LAQU0S03e06062g1_1 [Lachancea quebecensis]|uniref:LAQU0S03e06062g1_1 n=1 Tax=Lachancea quebecensis TaxID=1654605 RepID=A0A0P1KNP4_9SACH|nr:LAQU0S03e06062g1_1 [Lachancea quebecensis]